MVSEFNKKLEELDDLLDEAWTLPLANSKYIVNGDKLRGIIDALRNNLPSELKKAKDVLDARDKTLTRAREEADITTERARKNAEFMVQKAKNAAEEILNNARAEAEELINEQEITALANDRAAKIIEQAKQDALKMRNVALTYIDGVLNESERSLSNALATINQVKQSYGSSGKNE